MEDIERFKVTGKCGGTPFWEVYVGVDECGADCGSITEVFKQERLGENSSGFCRKCIYRIFKRKDDNGNW